LLLLTQWIYWLGPFMGSTLAAGFYKFISKLDSPFPKRGRGKQNEGG
jgi:hypothetical protein